MSQLVDLLHRPVPHPLRLTASVECRQRGLGWIPDQHFERTRSPRLRLSTLDFVGRQTLRTDHLLSLLGFAGSARCFLRLIDFLGSVDLWKSPLLVRRFQIARYLVNLQSPHLRLMNPDSFPILQTALRYLLAVVVRLIFQWLHELVRLFRGLVQLSLIHI